MPTGTKSGFSQEICYQIEYERNTNAIELSWKLTAMGRI